MDLNHQDIISEKEILNGLPEPIRYFLAIGTCRMPRSLEPVIKAFWAAANIINSVTHTKRRIHVLFGQAPFVINLKTGELRYTPNGEVIHATIEDFIFLDCIKTHHLPFQIQVACILEEFVHALMQISDENLTTQIVAWLYDGVRIVDGKYSPVIKTDHTLADEPYKKF
jgi:hypothetical protein